MWSDIRDGIAGTMAYKIFSFFYPDRFVLFTNTSEGNVLSGVSQVQLWHFKKCRD